LGAACIGIVFVVWFGGFEGVLPVGEARRRCLVGVVAPASRERFRPRGAGEEIGNPHMVCPEHLGLLGRRRCEDETGDALTCGNVKRGGCARDRRHVPFGE
jgi:hypothetical protein